MNIKVTLTKIGKLETPLTLGLTVPDTAEAAGSLVRKNSTLHHAEKAFVEEAFRNLWNHKKPKFYKAAVKAVEASATFGKKGKYPTPAAAFAKLWLKDKDALVTACHEAIKGFAGQLVSYHPPKSTKDPLAALRLELEAAVEALVDAAGMEEADARAAMLARDKYADLREESKA